MFELASTMRFYNGMRFNSMVRAIEEAKKVMAIHKGTTVIDVMRRIDKGTIRVVWTGDSAKAGYNRPVSFS